MLSVARPGEGFVLPVAAILLLAGCLLQFVAGYSDPDLSGHAWGCDDAYISYRYALNLASGQGLVFNSGERVEGFSNLLYVLLLTPVAALGKADPKGYFWAGHAKSDLDYVLARRPGLISNWLAGR
jgi:hypothetical protein